MFSSKKKIRKTLLNNFGKLKSASSNFEPIERYFQKKEADDTVFQTLSDKTCNDLDFDELFRFLDRTNSKIGQQFFYNKLRSIPANFHHLKTDETLIDKFSTDPNFRVAVQEQLIKLDDYGAYHIASLFQDEHQPAPKWFFLVPILSVISLLSIISSVFIPQMLLVAIVLFTINMGIHFWNKKNLYQYLYSLPQLIKLTNVAHKLYKHTALQPLAPTLTNSIQSIKKLNRKMPIFRLESKIQGDAQLILSYTVELLKIFFLLEPLFFFNVLKQLDAKRKELEALFSFIGHIDSLIAIAAVRKGLTTYCRPKIHGNTVIADQVYHPLIDDCVKNSIDTAQKSILLTGSNMSGKTSFIRAIGLNVITGLTINTCFATAITIPHARILSAIRISDDLMNDKSYYFEEVLTIKEMIDQKDGDDLTIFLLDELFKGTNTVERIAAGKAILSSLAKKNLVFVSTHDIELTDLLTDEYELYHFSEVVDQDSNSIDFDYKLKNGRLKHRNAIRILQINHYPSDIIDEAMQLSQQLDAAKNTGSN